MIGAISKPLSIPDPRSIQKNRDFAGRRAKSAARVVPGAPSRPLRVDRQGVAARGSSGWRGERLVCRPLPPPHPLARAGRRDQAAGRADQRGRHARAFATGRA